MLQSLKKIIVFRALIFAKIKELGKEKEAGKESDITESLRRENAEIGYVGVLSSKSFLPSV